MDPMLIMIILFLVVAVLFFLVLNFRSNGGNQKVAGLSPVSRQHLEIYQGQDLPVWLMDKTKNKISARVGDGIALDNFCNRIFQRAPKAHISIRNN